MAAEKKARTNEGPSQEETIDSTKDTINQIEIPTPDQKLEGFWIENGRYVTTYKKAQHPLSSFTMKFVYHLVDDSNDTTRIVLLERKTGERFLVEVKSSDLKLDKFEVIAKSHRCTFLGNTYNFK